MASDPPVIGFVLWRDAKADPPPEERVVVTDRGFMAHFDGLWYDQKEWRFQSGGPYPSVWCDPRPPVESTHGPLTMDDLRYALQSGIASAEDEATLYHVTDESGVGERVFAGRAARLRHAIEAIDSGKHVTPHDYQNGVNP